MKRKKAVLFVATVLTAALGASCSRTESTAAVEPQPAALAPEAAPVQPSAFKPVTAAVKPSPTPAVRTTPAPVAAAPTPAPVVKTKPLTTVTLAQGTVVPVRIGETLTSENASSGETWTGTLSAPVVVDGLVIAERGAAVTGRVTDVKRSGKVKGVGSVTITLTQIVTADGQRVPLSTSSFSARGKDETKRDVGKVAIASGIGAAIGAIAGGGKGAAIGAGVGAGGGTGVVLATRGKPAVISTEALVNFRVADPVTITEKAK